MKQVFVAESATNVSVTSLGACFSALQRLLGSIPCASRQEVSPVPPAGALVRHATSNAADLELVRNGRVLNFTDPSDRRIVEEFVTAAAAHGAIGIGAG